MDNSSSLLKTSLMDLMILTQALLPTIRMYYRANAGLLKLKEKQFIVTILKLMTVFKSGNFKGGCRISSL